MVVSYLHMHTIIFITTQNMASLSEMKADTGQKPPRDTLASYRMAKVLRNGDFLAKNQFGDTFLLSPTHHASSGIHCPLEGNVIAALQSIEDQHQMYQVFPFDLRLAWIGEILLTNKSQLFCVTLLNSALRHIIKPILSSNMAHPEKYLSIDNLWIKDTALYLFLKHKAIGKGLPKTENGKQFNRFYRVLELDPNGDANQRGLIKKFGEMMWMIFFKNEEEKSQTKRQTFREILTAMRKGELGLQELQSIMNEKWAVKKFMSSRKKNNTPRRILFDPQEDQQKGKQTIDLYERLENIPINMGKPQHGMLFSIDKKRKTQTIQEPSRTSNQIIFSSIQSDLPPSFSKRKKFRKVSIFSNSRSKSRNFSQNSRYDHQSLHSDTKNPKELSKRYEEENKNFSFAKEPRQSKLFNPLMSSLNKKRKSIKIREVFQEMIASKQAQYSSKIQKFSNRSREKALRKIQDNLTLEKEDVSRNNSNNKIDDEKFRSALKEKKNEYTQQMTQYFLKAKELYQSSKKKIRVSETTNTQLFDNWQKSAEKNIEAIIRSRTPRQSESVHEGKILNQDLFIDRKSYRQKEALIEEKLFQSRYEQSLEGNKSRFEDKSARKSPKKVKKNNFEEEILRQNTRKLSEKAVQPVLPQSTINNNVNNNKAETSKPVKKETQPSIDLPERLRTASHKDTQKSDSEVQLPSFANFKSKIVPNPKQQIQPEIKRENNEQPKKQVKKQQASEPPSKTIKEETLKSIIQEEIPPTKPNKIQIPMKALTNPPQNFYDKVQQNIFNEAPVPLEYVFTSKITPPKPSEPKKQQPEQPMELPAHSKPPIKKDKKQNIRSVPKYQGDFSDEIEEINLGVKVEKIPPKKQQEPLKISNDKKPPSSAHSISQKTQKQQQKQKFQKSEQRQESVKGRQKTNQSNASSNNLRSVKKIIDEYIFMINKMGEAVAKTAKLNKKLQKIQWYVGVYFLYKRFYFQRKKIETYLEQGIPKLTRHEQFSTQEWNEWLSKGERQVLLTKCKQDNQNIQNALKKMVKKVQTKQLPSRVLLNTGVTKNNPQCTKIAVEYVVEEYDQAVQLNLLSDPEVLIHLCQMANALHVMAELDGKIAQKRKIMQYAKINRTKQQLDLMIQTVYDLYTQQ